MKKRRKRKLTTRRTKSKKIKTEIGETGDGKNESKDSIPGQTCRMCFQVFTMPTRFESHMQLHEKRIPNLHAESTCPFQGCGQTFPDRISLSTHYDEHDQLRSPCGHCLKVLKKVKMRAHFFSDHPYRQFVCQICGKVCPFQSQLKQHTEGEFDG